jgi:hypothetical protein
MADEKDPSENVKTIPIPNTIGLSFVGSSLSPVPDPHSLKEANAILSCINPSSPQGKAVTIINQEIERLKQAQILITTSWVPPGIADDLVKQTQIETLHQVFKLISTKVNQQHLTELGLMNLYKELVIAYGGRGALP